MSRYGGADVPFLFVDSYDLLDHSILSVNGPAVEPVLERTDGLGQAWEQHTPVGLRRGSLSAEGYYDDSDLGTLAALITPGGVSRVVTTGAAGNVAGRNIAILSGAFAGKVSRGAKRGELTKASVDLTATGVVALNGVILQPLAAKTTTWNTEGAESVDNGASSSAGGIGVLHVKSNTIATSAVFRIRHSADDVTYADLDTFSTVTPWTPPAVPPAAAAQARTVAGTVNRHLAMSATLTGAGSITAMVGFARF